MAPTKQPAGSVGPMWPPQYEQGNDRVKGFYLSVVDDINEFVSLIDQLQQLQQSQNAGRVTARMIAKDGNTYVDGEQLEARIPLGGRWQGHTLLYYGRNHPSRKEQKRIKEQEERIIKTIGEFDETTTKDQAFRRVVNNHNMDLQILKNPTSSDIANIVELYASCYTEYTIPLDANGVKQLVTNPGNLVGVVRNRRNGKIASIGIAECNYKQINTISGNREFKFAEISDAATYSSEEGKGFYTGIEFFLLEQLAEKEFDLVYEEARACEPPINYACRRTGMNHYGWLEKHCVLNGRRQIQEVGKYENLNVWALTQTEIQKLFKE